MNNCNIDSEWACHLAQALCENTTLRDLNLSHNPFGREGAISLAGILHTNTSLQILVLSDCAPLGEKGTHKLLNAITINSTVQHLILPKECEEKFLKLSEVQSGVFFCDGDTLTPCEEWTVVAGLLMRLNAINYNFMMKGEDFNKSVSTKSFTDSV